MTSETLTPAQAKARVIRRADMVPEQLAFIDCKMPGSHLKQNYSLIGAGVTQSARQVVNIQEPHGFSLGVAAMPPGITNNLHIHYTAEVFMIREGRWTFRWGDGGRDGEIVGGPGDVVSIPTWIFRGFTNSGEGEGWIFTALGGDDTGGIIWHPSILEYAARHGLYLTRDNRLVDTEAGDIEPAPEARIRPLDAATIASLRHYTSHEMGGRVLPRAERAFSPRALLDSVLDGHGSAIAPAIGFGMTEDREQVPKIVNPHGFSVEWLRIAASASVGPFRTAEKQVLIVFEGTLLVAFGPPGAAISVQAEAGEVVSIPGNLWRTLSVSGGEGCELAVICAGDQRKRITWWRTIREQAAARDAGIDHNGYLAPARLLPASAAP